MFSHTVAVFDKISKDLKSFLFYLEISIYLFTVGYDISLLIYSINNKRYLVAFISAILIISAIICFVVNIISKNRKTKSTKNVKRKARKAYKLIKFISKNLILIIAITSNLLSFIIKTAVFAGKTLLIVLVISIAIKFIANYISEQIEAFKIAIKKDFSTPFNHRNNDHNTNDHLLKKLINKPKKWINKLKKLFRKKDRKTDDKEPILFNESDIQCFDNEFSVDSETDNEFINC